MADVIPASDRALIDAALAAGRVRRIPRGVSGEGEWRYDAGTNSIVEVRKRRGGHAKSLHPHNDRLRAEKAARHDRIVRMLAEGRHIKPRALGITAETLRSDLKTLRQQGRIG